MKNKKRGFTIVELVIVIAVIGILTAVLVPIFSGLIAKANLANDNLLVKNINTQLEAAEIEDGKNKNMTLALEDAKEAGYLIGNINARSENQLVWDQDIDRFALINKEGTAVVAGQTNNLNNKSKLWKIYSNYVAEEYQEYSMYAGKNYNLPDNKIVKIKVGFDVGENENITDIRYESELGNDVIIRTNGGTLTVNTDSDTVNHYGSANVVDLQNAAQNSYHEFETATFVKLAKGRLVVEKGAEVGGVHITAKQDQTFDKVAIALVGDEALPALSRDDVSLENGQKKLVVEVQTVATSTEVDQNPEYVWIVGAGENVETKVTSDQEGQTEVADASQAAQAVETAVEEAKTVKEAENEAVEVVTPVFDESYVARIGINGYKTIEDAVMHYADGTILMLQDIEMRQRVELIEQMDVTINLDGHTLTMNGTSDSRVLVNYGTLTVSNGKVRNIRNSAYGIIDSYGILNLKNIEISDNGTGNGSSVKIRSGSADIQNCSFNNTGVNLGNAGIYIDGNVSLDGCEFRSTSNRAYCLISNTGSSTIKNVTIDGTHGGLGVNGGTVVIENVTSSAKNYYALWITNDSDTNTNVTIKSGLFTGNLYGLYSSIDDGHQDAGNVAITIEGGTFTSTGKGGMAVKNSDSGQDWDIQVKGGSYSTNPSAYLADGYVATEGSNGYWTVSAAE